MSTEALHHKITDGQNKVDSMNLDGSSSDMDDEEFFDPDEEGVTFEKSFDSNDGNNIERLLMLQAAVTNHSHNRPGARCPVPNGMPLIKSGDQVSAGLRLHRWRHLSGVSSSNIVLVGFRRIHRSFMHHIYRGQCP